MPAPEDDWANFEGLRIQGASDPFAEGGDPFDPPTTLTGQGAGDGAASAQVAGAEAEDFGDFASFAAASDGGAASEGAEGFGSFGDTGWAADFGEAS